MFKVNFYGFFEGFDPNNNFIMDAIKKVGEVEISDYPDYVFYSVFSNEYLLYPNAVRIFFTGENVAPNFQLCDYAIGFERLEYEDRYIRYPFYYGMKEYALDLKRAREKHLHITNEMFSRQFCSFVYSNDDTDGARKQLFAELNQYKMVSSGGRLFNNVSERVTDKFEFEKKHKFSIACENSSHNGYCTEKILQSFGAQTVPIYYGDKTVAFDYNEKAFVNCHAYKNIEEAISHVIYLDQHEDAYLKILRHKAFADEQFAENMQKRFEAFIENIFVQAKEIAFRRNRFFWGKKIDDKYKRIYKLEKIAKKITRK